MFYLLFFVCMCLRFLFVLSVCCFMCRCVGSCVHIDVYIVGSGVWKICSRHVFVIEI